MDVLSIARDTIQQEAQAISGLEALLTPQLEQVVAAMLACTGRVVIAGIGKSAIIAQKIVATFNSTGTPAIFLHAADAIHGDLGMIQEGDVVLIISKSGNSPEIKVLVPLVKNFGNTIVGMVGNTASFLARHSHYVLDTTVQQEACPHNLAPTTSTTAQLVMGDVLAVCLMHGRGFNDADFAKFHPGGTLGKKLYLRVADVFADNEKPVVLPHDTLKQAIVEITKKRLGVTAVAEAGGALLGIITDGDLRRMLEQNTAIDQVLARDIMTRHPKTIQPGELAVSALDLMRKHAITQLVVTDASNRYLGIIHIHDLLKEGLI